MNKDTLNCKHNVFDKYVLTPVKNAFNENTSWWLSKKDSIYAMYCFSTSGTAAEQLEIAECHMDNIKSYIAAYENKFGDLHQNFAWTRYVAYLKRWADSHSDSTCAGMSPVCFDEWMDNENCEECLCNSCDDNRQITESGNCNGCEDCRNNINSVCLITGEKGQQEEEVKILKSVLNKALDWIYEHTASEDDVEYVRVLREHLCMSEDEITRYGGLK